MSNKISISKYKIDKKIRGSLIIISVMLSIFISFLLYSVINHPVYKEEINTLYSYSSKGNIDYRVILKPNVIYESGNLGEGLVYLTNYVDLIEVDLDCEFKGQRVAPISGVYEVVAKLTGFFEEEKKQVKVWEKQFILVPKTEFNVSSDTMSLEKKVKLNLEEYNNFIDKIVAETKVEPYTQLNLGMYVNLKANTDKGIIEQKISPEMILPLNVSHFTITEQHTEELPGAIEETQKIQIPVNRSLVTIYGCILGGILILLIFICFFTTNKAKKDDMEKRLDNIFKQYSNRLIGLNGWETYECVKLYKVKSIEDLIKIADEIGKPVMYINNEVFKNISKFHILDNNVMYIYDLMDDSDKVFIHTHETEGISL